MVLSLCFGGGPFLLVGIEGWIDGQLGRTQEGAMLTAAGCRTTARAALLQAQDGPLQAARLSTGRLQTCGGRG